MSARMKRVWWRAAVVGLVGGAVAGGGWLGLSRVAEAQVPFRTTNADPAPAKPKDEAAPAVWTRANAPVPTPAAAPPVAASGAVTPAAAVLPALPVIPPTVSPPPPMVTMPPAVPAIPMPPATLPALPGVPAGPEFRPVVAPPVAAPVAKPAADPTLPQLPPLPPLSGEPPMAKPPAAAIPLPPVSAAPVFKAVEPASPVALPPLPLTPPAPPAKSADPAKPVPPAAPDFNLRPGNGGNNVKPGASAAAPVLPALPAGPEADRSKPADGPFGASDKYVFPLPQKTPGAVAAAPVSRPTAAPVPTPVFPDPLARPPGTGIAGPVLPAAPTAPGDDTMKLKQTALAAALGGAVALAPTAPAVAFPTLPAKDVAAVPPAPASIGPVAPHVIAPAVPTTSPVAKIGADPAPDAKTTDERLKGIEKQLADLAEMMKGRKDAQGFALPSDPGLLAEVRKLKDEIAGLKSRVEAMEKSTSLRPSTGGTAPAPAATAGRGTVRVVNDYPVEITIVVNDASYRIGANKTREIDVAAGKFTYLLLSSGIAGTPTESSIKEREVVTLRIK